MSLIVGALRAVFGADTAAFEKGIDQVDRKLKSSQRAFAKFGKKVQGVGKSMSVGFTAPLAAIGAASFKTATSMVELESAFDVTFKGASDSMRAWAQETGDTLSRSTKEIQTSAVAFASLFNKALDPDQANELTKQFSVLTQDLASFKDLSNDVAQQKLFSGLTGEAEPLKSVGVFINAAATEAKALELGLEKVNGKFTDQQKIIARAALIQEQLAEAQGDVIRTSDSTANQIKRAGAAWEELRVVIGTKLLPVLTPLIERLADALDWFSNLSDGAQNTILVMGGIVAAIGPVLTVVGGLSSVLAPLGAALAVATGATTGLAAAMTVALGPIGLLVVAIGGLVLAYKQWGGETKAARRAHEDLYKLIDESKKIRETDTALTKEATLEQIKNTLAKREQIKALLDEKRALLEQQSERIKALSRSSSGSKGGADLGAVRGFQATQKAIEDGQAALDENAKHVERLRKQYDELKNSAAGAGAATTKLTAAQIDAKKAQAKAAKDLAKAQAKARDDHKDVLKDSQMEIESTMALAEALKVSQREYEIVSEKLNLISDGFMGTDEAARALAVSLVDARASFDVVKEGIDAGAKAAEDKKQKLMDLAEEMRRTTQAMAEAHNNTTASIEKEIEDNAKLVAALKISQREYEITAQVLRMLESGYLGTAESARVLAEKVVDSRDALSDAADEARKTEEALKKAGTTGVDAFTQAANSFSEFLGALKSGDLEGILGGIGGLLGDLFGGGSNKSGGGFGDILGGIGTIFGGFRAKGGGVESGKTYVVGENGPELFTPPSNGNIIPNDKMGGIVNVMVTANDYFDARVTDTSAKVAEPISQASTVQGLTKYNKTSRARGRQRLSRQR